APAAVRAPAPPPIRIRVRHAAEEHGCDRDEHAADDEPRGPRAVGEVEGAGRDQACAVREQEDANGEEGAQRSRHLETFIRLGARGATRTTTRAGLARDPPGARGALAPA